jgi:hypothetical protein
MARQYAGANENRCQGNQEADGKPENRMRFYTAAVYVFTESDEYMQALMMKQTPRRARASWLNTWIPSPSLLP